MFCGSELLHFLGVGLDAGAVYPPVAAFFLGGDDAAADHLADVFEVVAGELGGFGGGEPLGGGEIVRHFLSAPYFPNLSAAMSNNG